MKKNVAFVPLTEGNITFFKITLMYVGTSIMICVCKQSKQKMKFSFTSDFFFPGEQIE